MKSFDTDGLWWDPKVPNEKWHGTLTFDEDNGTSLKVTMLGENATVFSELKSYDLLLGKASNGKLFTLLDCFDRTSQPSFFGVPRSVTIYANRLLAGFHADRIDPLVSSISAEFQNLREWFGRTGISVEMPAAGRLTARHEPTEPVLLFEDDQITVSLRSGASSSSSRYRFSVEEGVWFEVTARVPLPFSLLEPIARCCGDLLSIACMTHCKSEELTLVLPREDDGRIHSGTFHAIPRYKDRTDPERTIVGKALFTFEDIQARASSIFAGWLSTGQELRDARALCFEGLYGKGFVEHKLLALTQAAEAIHRRLHPDRYISDEEFDGTVLAPLVAAIPKGIDSALREAITARLRFANEFSQRRRLRAMCSEHAAALESLTTHPFEVVNRIVNTRNEFTHFPVPSAQSQGSHRATPEQVLFDNWFLRLLIEACFLGVMGFSRDETAEMVSGSDTYRQIARRFGDGYSVAGGD